MKTPAAPLSALIAGLVAVSVSPHSRAQTERDLDSHEHGQALMSLVIDGNKLVMELESPWMNLIGFEHSPETEDQKQLLANALGMLGTPATLFNLPENADCELLDVVRHDDFGMHDDEHASDEGHDEEHDHSEEHASNEEHADEHGHDEEHASDKDHAEEHDHDEEHAAEEEHADQHGHDHDEAHASDDEHASDHSELHIEYQFNCSSVDELASLDVKLFELWPGMEDLDVQSIGPSGQGLETLTAGRPTLDLSSIN